MKRGLLMLLGLMPLLYAAADVRSTAQEPCGNVPASLCQADEAFTPTVAPLVAVPGSSSSSQLSDAGAQAAKTRLPVLCLDQWSCHKSRKRIFRTVLLCGTPRTIGYLTCRPADRFLYPFRKIVI